ncbi:hypothetical protein SLEP1_g36927 [Rubroshorea leprosula]|uniref:Uncharacterized protein n=1 Tax=Rubroshorea leprosula TaxID=152421 RepID=A0AAV5KT25_9ROSI|nr:hypothetical protein SLEP1_g36927 [Rubroshorea leprosula]
MRFYHVGAPAPSHGVRSNNKAISHMIRIGYEVEDLQKPVGIAKVLWRAQTPPMGASVLSSHRFNHLKIADYR